MNSILLFFNVIGSIVVFMFAVTSMWAIIMRWSYRLYPLSIALAASVSFQQLTAFALFWVPGSEISFSDYCLRVGVYIFIAVLAELFLVQQMILDKHALFSKRWILFALLPGIISVVCTLILYYLFLT
ncbi:hypothetical protein HGA91_05985 [candidate division WWE3 bacterium]|nr:hypothetical protein [candidate division WWE3 bacterium]